MKQYKLIASDLDGTLLNSKMQVSKENAAAITEMRERGIYFVPATGRTLDEMDPAIRDHPAFRYIIYSDGAGIWDKESDQKDLLCMDRELNRRIFDILADYEYFGLIHYDGVAYVDADRMDRMLYYQMNEYYTTMIPQDCRPIKDYERFLLEKDELELFFLFFHSDEKLLECRARIDQLEGVQTASSAQHSFEIVSDRAGKGGALLALAKRLGVDPSLTIAVGDGTNDCSMIRDAALGLAMENACDELKEMADAVACNNDQHIAQYILENYIGS